MTPKEQDLKNRHDLIYENISRKLTQQIESLGSLDTKASIMLAFVGVIFAGYCQLLTADRLGFTDYPVLICLELLTLIVAGFFVFKTFFLRDEDFWRDDPRPDKLLAVFRDNPNMGEYSLKNEIYLSMSKSYTHNDALIKEKFIHLHTAKRILYIGVVIMFIHIFAVLIGC